MTSLSHARTWKLGLEHLNNRNEDKTEDSSSGGPDMYRGLTPHKAKSATVVQDVKHTGTAIVKGRKQDDKCQNLKPRKEREFAHLVRVSSKAWISIIMSHA